MIIKFQNVRSITNEKLEILSKQLKNTDVIGLGELNKKWDFPNFNSRFQHHVDPSTNRIGLIAANTVDFSYIGLGIRLEQERTQTDKTAVQSNVYRINASNGHTVHIENFYIVPDAKPEIIRYVAEHLDRQANRFKIYIAGGDFNINWKSYKQKEQLCLSVAKNEVNACF